MTETPTTDLAAWLTAIWDEEERLARDADVKQGDLVWWVSHVAMSRPQAYTVRSKRDNRPIARVVDVAGDEDSDITGILDGGAAAAHIAYRDPASVLARIAADRKILALHGMTRISWDKGCVDPTMHQREYCGICDHGRDDDSPYPSQSNYPCTTVRLLAEPHADKPGFRSEWLVERQGVEQ